MLEKEYKSYRQQINILRRRGIGCGGCTAHCPQSLPVPDAMREMAEILEKMK